MATVNVNPITLQARALRRSAGPAEAALWALLRGKRLGGYKFVRQQPIGHYFADFVCRSQRLVIEVDDSQAVDRSRDEYLLRNGYSVFRVPSAMVLTQRADFCATILAALEGRLDRVIEADDLRYREAEFN
jgi:very-short-patch-repair endonuclease